MERVIPYADRAAELERVDACVANDLRMLAVQIGLPLAKDAASKKYVAAMLDRLERDKPALAAVGAADRAARAQALALDLYRRALGADKPELSPHPRLPWCVTHAPRVAQCFHACAVALDAMRLYVEPRQTLYVFLTLCATLLVLGAFVLVLELRERIQDSRERKALAPALPM